MTETLGTATVKLGGHLKSHHDRLAILEERLALAEIELDLFWTGPRTFVGGTLRWIY